MKLVVLAVTLAVIGFAFTWVAVRAVFRPVRFRGIPPLLGWQGLVPRRAGVIAAGLTEQIMNRVGTLHDVYTAADPERIAEHLVLSLRPRMPEIVEDVLLDADPQLWDTLPAATKDEINARLDDRLADIVPGLLDEVEADLDELVSIDYLTEVHLADDPGMLVGLIEAVGRREILFLERVGLPVGVVAALGSVVANTAVMPWWVDAIASAAVFGVGTHIGVRMVFGWPQPRTFGPFTFHGLLYQEQDNAVRVATRIFTRDILTVSHLVTDTFDGPNGDRARAIVRRHVTPLVEYGMQPALDHIRRYRSADQVTRLVADLTDAAIGLALEPLHEPTFNRERQIVLEDVFVHRMLDLTPEDYGSLIRPALGGYERWLAPVAAVAGFLGGTAAYLFEISNPLHP